MKLISLRAVSIIGAAVWLVNRYRNILVTEQSGQSLLWQVGGNGLLKPSYFFGTMHLMCAEDAMLNKTLRQVIRKVKQVYLEVDMDPAGHLQGGVVDFSMRDNGKLADYLSQEEYVKVRSFFENLQPGLPFDLLETQHPLMLSSSLYEFFLPCEKKNGMELKILEEAHRLKKEIKGLETLDFQQNIFNSIPYGEQAKDLVKSIDQIDHFTQTMHQMIAVYKAQNIEKLFELTMDDDSGVNNHLDMLLYTRNRVWAEQAVKIAQDKPSLFAVGAGHLGGQQGVLNLLKLKGYTIRPIKNG